MAFLFSTNFANGDPCKKATWETLRRSHSNFRRSQPRHFSEKICNGKAAHYAWNRKKKRARTREEKIKGAARA
jgi:hypothetical protein